MPKKITTILSDVGKRKLQPGWKSWSCPKCGDGFLYIGKRPKHKNCKGYFVFKAMWSVEAEQELIDFMAEEIKKEMKNGKRKPLFVYDSISEKKRK